MINRNCCIGLLGTGSYLPEKIVTNEQMETMIDTSDEWITTRTGIKARHFAAATEATSDLATEAARRALADAGISAQELGLIIVATVTPDRVFPSTACMVQNNIGATSAFAYDLGAACSGFIFGLSTAYDYLCNHPDQYALVIGAETLSRVINPADRSTFVLFGDGAGAAVLGKRESGGIVAFDLGSDGAGGNLLSVEGGGSRHPATHETVDQGLHYITMNGKEVFKFAVKVMGESALRALAKVDKDQEQIDYWIPHQANIRIIESAVKRLGLAQEKVYVNLNHYGNMSAASIPVALDEVKHQGNLQAGDTLVLTGFGAGLTWGSCVISW